MKPMAMLDGLSYGSRFMMLLFCTQKYTIPQIAETMRLPAIIVHRRLNAAARKLAA